MDLFEYIIKHHPEVEVFELIDDAMHDYIDSDWEDEFDNINEAYEETGRGEAESHVLGDLIRKAVKSCKTEISDDQYCELFDRLAEQWCLNTN